MSLKLKLHNKIFYFLFCHLTYIFLFDTLVIIYNTNFFKFKNYKKKLLIIPMSIEKLF